MENFVVSARKYRPATFKSVVGQQHITTTLQNAIKNNHLAQAFLFCGPRGVGKTTCARILAKTINCTNPTSDMEACDACDSCRSFNESASFNIFELDAASNNSVDDIRSLVDQVRIPPQSSRYKVYIIDEVHMLSQAAFNAFLKTLEEPPTYAKFILATTEKHKIIPTILSRCQIFDFKRIKNDDIATHLEYVAKEENVSFEEDALHIIAQKAEGGLRDALSMFDQLVSFTGGQLTYNNIIENLNVLDYDYYFKVTDALLKGDISQSLLIYREIAEKGFDGQHFITGLASHFRNLLVCKDPVTHKLLEVSDNIRAKYGEQSSNCSIAFLLKVLDISNECDLQYKDANNKTLKIEIALIKMASLLNQPLMPTHAAHSHAPVQEKAPEQPKVPVVETKVQTPVPAQQAVNATPVQQPVITEEKVVQNTANSGTPPPAIKMPSSPSTISINKIADPSVGEKKNIETKKEITQQELEKCWNAFAESFKEDKQNLYFAMLRSVVQLKNGNTASVEVKNGVDEIEIEKVKRNLIDFIRQETKIEAFRISLDVEASGEEKESKPYTPKDKFLFMAEKNPNIKILRANLDLDIDY